jgi:RNA polymerase sigma factor (sigma-70 family)
VWLQVAITDKDSIKIAEAVVNILVERGLVSANANKNTKSAYAKTESLLYTYNSFKKTIRQKQQEIEDIRKYGVPQKGGAVVEWRGNTGGQPRGIVLPEESVENAIKRVEASMVETLRAIDLVDKGLEALKTDPYYKILPLRYFEGQTQEDIATQLGVSQVTISNNKSRLIKELSMQIFPKQTVEEMLN